MRIAMIAPFPPSEGGIVEFAGDFATALREVDPGIHIRKVPILSKEDTPEDPKVLTRISKLKKEEYARAATDINDSDVDIVVIQHEFAEYGGNHGDYIIDTILRLKKPVFLIAHTVPVDDDAHHRRERESFFKKIASHMTGIVTFLPQGRSSLISYGVPQDRISVIPHAVPIFDESIPKTSMRLNLHLPTNRFIALSFGFIHPNKGTIFTIEAMRLIKEKHLPIHFLCVGGVLPNEESNRYIQVLNKKIAAYELSDSVHIVIEYVTHAKLSAYIQASDIGIVPYIYRSYTASGPLSFFIGGGKPIITTPFAYASSLLTPENACIVPFEDSEAIAKGIEKLSLDQSYYQSLERKTCALRETLRWNVTAKKYLDFFQSCVE